MDEKMDKLDGIEQENEYYTAREQFIIYLGQGLGCGIVVLSIGVGVALVLWGWPNG